MELTRFDMQTQAIQRRIAVALERIAAALERANPPLEEAPNEDSTDS